MRQFYLLIIMLFLVASSPLLNGAEKYESEGFCAELGSSGIITRLSCDGIDISNRISLVGQYLRMPGEPKYDAHFYQKRDRSDSALFEWDGDRLVMSVDSVLENEKKKNAVNYKVLCEIEPYKISFEYEVKINVTLHTRMRIFESQVAMLPGFYGRGAKTVSAAGVEEFRIIPKKFNPKFKMGGNVCAISTGEGSFSIVAGDDTRINYVDTRSWGGKNFFFAIGSNIGWNSKPVRYEAGTVWRWKFTMVYKPDR